MQFRLRVSVATLLALGWTLTVSAKDLATVESFVPSPEQVLEARGSTQLILANGIYDPLEERLVLPVHLKVESNSDWFIAQFQPDQRPPAGALASVGARLLSPWPEHAYLIRGSAAVRAALAQRADMRAIVDYDPAFRIAPALLAAIESEDAFSLRVLSHAHAELGATRLPAPLGLSSPLPGFANRASLRVDIAPGALLEVLEALLANAEVAYIERLDPVRPFNTESVGPIQGNVSSGGTPPVNAPIWARGLLGTGQIVAVADSGLDRNEAWFNRRDTGSGQTIAVTDAQNTQPPAVGTLYPANKVIGYFVMPGASAYDDTRTCPGGFPTGFHGTHVTGTVAGDRGIASTPVAANYDNGDGMAPQAQILFQDIGNDETGCLSGIGGSPMARQARDAGAGISSNSYGSNFSGAYNSSDADADFASWSLEDLLIVFAAGNEGPGSRTIGHPAHAKNVLTVGALGRGLSTTAASFSSRGPTADGRLKPEIMAPGSSIVSARGNDDDANPPADPNAFQTASNSGTSMATPTISGGAALMRQYFWDGYYPTGARVAADARRPLSAELKAAILNGSALFGTTPSNTLGWGRMFLDENLYFPSDTRRLRLFGHRHESGLQTGDEHSYQVTVGASAELRVTLVWNDPPAQPGAGVALVNDLDLSVEGPGGTYLGNVLSGSGTATTSVTGGAADRVNPLEQVRLPTPTAGTYTVRVRGHQVPGSALLYSDRQGYGLAVSHAQCSAQVAAAPTAVTATAEAAGIRVQGAAVANATGYQLYRANGTCSSASPRDFQLVGSGSTPSLLDDRAQGGFDYAYKLRAVDGCGEGPLSACVDATSIARCELFPSFDASQAVAANDPQATCGIALNWPAAQTTCPGTTARYNLYRSSDPFFTPTAGNRFGTGLTALNLRDFEIASGQTYYYAVRAEDTATGGNGPNGGNELPTLARVRATTLSNSYAPGTFRDGADAPAQALMQAPWSVSDARVDSGRYAYRSAPRGAAQYSPDTCASISFPVRGISATSILSYRARYNLESEWDGVVVEISTDGGQNFVDLPPAGGYPSSFAQTGASPINACGYAASRRAFSGSSGGAFVSYSSPLAAYAGQDALIRFRISSDPGAEEEGFYLDTLVVNDVQVAQQCVAHDPIFANGVQ